TADGGIGVGKISSEGDGISWLQLYLLFFWSEADISRETVEEFLRAREMSEGAVGCLCRQLQLIDAHTMTAAINKQCSAPQPSIGYDDLSFSSTDDGHLRMVLLSEKGSNRDVQCVGDAIQDLKRRIALSRFKLGEARFRDASHLGEGSK